jgi:hypothetical protein
MTSIEEVLQATAQEMPAEMEAAATARAAADEAATNGKDEG